MMMMKQRRDIAVSNRRHETVCNSYKVEIHSTHTDECVLICATMPAGRLPFLDTKDVKQMTMMMMMISLRIFF